MKNTSLIKAESLPQSHTLRKTLNFMFDLKTSNIRKMLWNKNMKQKNTIPCGGILLFYFLLYFGMNFKNLIFRSPFYALVIWNSTQREVWLMAWFGKSKSKLPGENCMEIAGCIVKFTEISLPNNSSVHMIRCIVDAWWLLPKLWHVGPPIICHMNWIPCFKNLKSSYSLKNCIWTYQ